MRNDLIIIYKIKLNEGPKAGQIVTLITSIEQLQEEDISTLLIEKGHLESWCNNGEYDIVERHVPPVMGKVMLVPKSLAQLLDEMPTSIDWKGQEVMFSVFKNEEGYMCSAFLVNQFRLFNKNTPIEMAEGEALEFQADTPEVAVTLMLTYLKMNNLIPA